MNSIVLASESKYKLQVIEKLGIKVISSAPRINEASIPGETPEELVARLSIAKARTVAGHFSQHLIIGADQVAEFNGKIITKPGNHKQATVQLGEASGNLMTFLTGIALLNSSSGRVQYRLSKYEVKFRQLSSKQIENYLQREKPYDCAGSFKSEGLGISLFEYIRGDDPNALIGLPLIELTQMLLNEGVDVLAQPAAGEDKEMIREEKSDSTIVLS